MVRSGYVELFLLDVGSTSGVNGTQTRITAAMVKLYFHYIQEAGIVIHSYGETLLLQP